MTDDKLDRIIQAELDVYWKDLFLGFTATIVRMAFFYAYKKGYELGKSGKD